MTRTVDPPVEAAITNVLRGVIDPELGDNIVDLGMVQRIDIDADNSVAITIALTTAADIQMGLARMLPRTDVIIVTTPTLAAQKVAARAADMARKGHLRVAGVIENMSATIEPDGTRHAIFGEGGGERLTQQLGVALLGSIPLDPTVSAGGDIGEPAVLGDPEAPAAQAFARLADRIVTDTIPPVELAVCSIRQLLTEAGADLASAFERLQQSHELVTATAPANDYDQSRSNP